MKSRPNQRPTVDGKSDKSNQRISATQRELKRPAAPETERKLDDIGKNIARLRSKLAKLAAARARENRKSPKQGS